MKTEAEMEGGGHKPRDPWSPQSWKRQEGPYPGASGGTSALHHLDGGFPGIPGAQVRGRERRGEGSERLVAGLEDRQFPTAALGPVPSLPRLLLTLGLCCVAVLSRSVVFSSLRAHGLQPTSFLCPFGFSR